MKRSIEQPETAETIHLQGIGKVPAMSVENLKVGDVIIWNYGNKSRIISISPTEAKKMMNIELQSLQDGVLRNRRMLASTLVGIEYGENRAIEQIKKANQQLDRLEHCDISNGRSLYVSDKYLAPRLSMEEAFAALRNDVRIGYANEWPEYHGSRKGEYVWNPIKSSDALKEFFSTGRKTLSISLDPAYEYSALHMEPLKEWLSASVAESGNAVAYKNKEGLSKGVRDKLEKMERDGHRFSKTSSGKIVAPEKVGDYLSDEDIREALDYISERQKKNIDREEPEAGL